MANSYKSLDAYVEAMVKQYPISDSEFSRIGKDGDVRNYIASQIQRLEDNGFDISGIQAFYDQVGANSSDGFAHYSGSKIGGREISSIYTTMMRLDEMQSDGRISVNEYNSYMNQLLNPDTISDIAGGGKGGVLNLFDNIEHDSERAPDPTVAAANKEALAIEARTYINDRNDYYSEARDFRANDADYTAAHSGDGYDVFADMNDKLREAYEAGYLTEDQFNDARNGLRSYQNGSTSTERTNTMLYALEDSLASGDKELIGRVMSSDGFSAITAKTIGDTGLDLLRDIERSNVVIAHSGEIGVEPEPPASIPAPVINPVPVAGFDDLPRADIGARDLADIVDTMGKNYFEKSEADGGLSLDDYSAMLEEYNALETDEEKEAYKVLNKDFAEADAYMQKLDALEDGVMSGKLYINVTEDLSGNTTYGISYPDKPAGSNKNPLGWLVQPIEPLFQPNDETRAKFEFGDDFLADLNAATAEVKGDDRETHGSEFGDSDPDNSQPDNSQPDNSQPDNSQPDNSQPDNSQPDNSQPDNSGTDFDASLDGVDLSTLTAMSPEEQANQMLTVAQDIWAGKYGNGADRTAALEAMGYSDEDRKMIQEMVNKGAEWCRSATMDDFDAAFPDPSGVSLADREAEFREAQMNAAMSLMTYEGADDFLEAYNAAFADPDDPSTVMTAEQAEELYDRAAHVMDGDLDYANELGGAEYDTMREEGMCNLMDYVAEHPDGGFVMQEPTTYPSNATPEVTNPETGNPESSVPEGEGDGYEF